MFQGIIDQGRIPSMSLVSKSPGTGKTTIARTLCKEVKAMVLFVNGADCKIDYIRNDLKRFASTMVNFDEYPGGKVIIIDEFDRKGLHDAQDHLRSFSEAYSENVSIIITANNADGISEALQSRAPIVQFGNPTKEDKIKMQFEMIKRAKTILDLEEVVCEDVQVLKSLVQTNFPDFRKTVKMLDRYSKSGNINSGILAEASKASDIDALIIAMKTKNIRDIRELSSRYVHDYATFITTLYNTMYAQVSPASIPTVIMTIGENQKYYRQVANLEIHLQYLLIQLTLEVSWKEA